MARLGTETTGGGPSTPSEQTATQTASARRTAKRRRTNSSSLADFRSKRERGGTSGRTPSQDESVGAAQLPEPVAQASSQLQLGELAVETRFPVSVAVQSRARSFAQYGILEWIRLENFMCHRCFEVKFGPNVNIISGPNGSGKSAIVAALQLVFGSSSTSTDRGRRARDLIRIGASSGLVAVRLKNRPDETDAVDGRFRPDVYGDSIVIQRRLTRTGVSKWSFHNAEGRRVQTERSARLELEAIMDHFSIQVSNPVAILTQKKSKEFLSSGKPSDLYKFFMEATKLGEVRDALMEVRNQAAEIRSMYGRKEAEIPRLQTELNAAKAAFEEAQRIEHLEEELKSLREHYAWALVAEAEHRLAHALEDRNKAQNLIDEGERRLGLLENEISAKSDELNNRNRELREINEMINRDISEETNVEAALREVRAEIRRLEQQRARLSSIQTNRKDERDAVLAEQEKLRHRSISSDSQLVQHHQQLQQLMDEIARLSTLLETKRCLLNQLETQLETARADQAQLRTRLQLRESALRQAERSLVELQQSTQDPRVIFGGPHVTALLADVERAMEQKIFSRKPIGPLGSFLRVRDPKWTLPIEFSISAAVLSAFVVHNLTDAEALRRLAEQRKYPIPRILVQDMDAPLYRPRAELLPPAELITVHSQIRIEAHEQVLQNVLMDHAETELNLLFDTAEDARRAAFELRPRNARVCWSAGGDRAQVGAGGSNQFRAGPDPSRYTPKLAGDIEHQIILKQRLLENERREYELLKVRETDCKNTVDDLERRRSQIAQDLVGLENEERMKRHRIELLRESREDETTDAFLPDAYQERVAAIDAELESISKQLQVYEDEIKLAKDKENEIEKRDRDRRRMERELEERRRELAKNCRTLAAEHAQLQAELQALRSGIEKEQVNLGALETRLETLRNELRREEHNALQVCARLECEIGPVQELRIEIASLESRVQTEQKRLDGFSILQLQERYERAQQSYDTIKTELGALERLLQRIEDGLVERVKSFIQLRAQIQKHVSAYFGYYIHMRGHYGSIKFDDRSQEMRLRVAISHHRTHEGELCFAQDLRSLSGGERSFTTLALMLALGEAMEAPFRIMDEFDVFMDEANRRVAYKTLIDIAKRESRRQFVFITPLTLPNLRADPECVRVVRLVPPVRGTDNVQQTILDDFAPNAGDVTDPQ